MFKKEYAQVFAWFAQWRNNRILQKSKISETQWSQAFAVLPILSSLSADEKQRLHDLVILFLHKKSIEAARGFNVSEHMALVIALQACLPILNLGLDWYRGWVSIIVYPAQFMPQRMTIDSSGVEHAVNQVLSGEAWHKGPVILSWEDSERGGETIDGANLVIHEFAHKLDMLNNNANGFPPLHKGMNKQHWTQALSAAFSWLNARLVANLPIPIDAYAASSPAEFFAVISEVFFERPDIVNRFFPDVFSQLVLFYRQNPLARFVEFHQ